MIYKSLFLYLAAVLGLSFSLHSQSNFVATGSNQTGTTGSVSMTVGQVLYTSHTSSGGSVNGGVQQVYTIEIIDGIEQEKVNLNLTAYPNPTTENVWIRIESAVEKALSYIIMENSGKIVSESEINETETEVDMSQLANGSYFLMVKEGQQNIKTFKIQKLN